ncbi:unnamed protein product [Arabidopsis lyrata]|nr:unnamed protein product [Arabidopsis lyrata]
MERQVPLPRGVRFSVKDIDLIDDFLRPHVNEEIIQDNVIESKDIYEKEPGELEHRFNQYGSCKFWAESKVGDKDRYSKISIAENPDEDSRANLSWPARPDAASREISTIIRRRRIRYSRRINEFLTFFRFWTLLMRDRPYRAVLDNRNGGRWKYRETKKIIRRDRILGHKETVDFVTNQGVTTGWRQHEYRLASDDFQTKVLVHLYYDVAFDKTRQLPIPHEQQRQPRRARQEGIVAPAICENVVAERVEMDARPWYMKCFCCLI